MQEVLNSVTFSPDGRAVAAASQGPDEWLWDAEMGRSLTWLCGHNGHVTSASFSPCGQEVVTSSSDGTARIWSVRDERRGELARDGTCRLVLSGHKAPLTCALFSPDGLWVATASEDQTARLWDAETGECARHIRGHGSKVCAVAFSPNGAIIATAGVDCIVRLWDAHSGLLLRSIDGHADQVMSLAFGPR